MRNAGLDEAQAGIKIAGRTINNLRYADDITLMAKSEEETKDPLAWEIVPFAFRLLTKALNFPEKEALAGLPSGQDWDGCGWE